MWCREGCQGTKIVEKWKKVLVCPPRQNCGRETLPLNLLERQNRGDKNWPQKETSFSFKARRCSEAANFHLVNKENTRYKKGFKTLKKVLSYNRQAWSREDLYHGTLKDKPRFFFATKFSATFKKGIFNPGKYQTLAAERYPANILEPATQVKPFAKASIKRTSFLGSVSLNKLPSPDPPSNSRLNYFKGTFVILKNVYGDQLNLTGPAKNSEIIKRRTLFFKSKQPLALKIFV